MDTWRRNFLILWTGQFVSISGLTVMVPLMPLFIEELTGTSGEAAAWWTGVCLAAPAVTSLFCAPLWGRLGDEWGRKWMVVRALGGLVISLALMGFCRSPWQFLLCRLFQGACGGVVDAAAAFAGSEAPPERKGQVLGRLNAATAAGSVLGPLMGGMLADLAGFRSLFFIMAALTGVLTVTAACFLRETNIVRQRESQEKSAVRPLKEAWLSLVRHRETRAFLCGGVFAQAGIYGVTAVFALHVAALSGDSSMAATWVGLLQAVTWLSVMVASPWWGKRNDTKPVHVSFVWAALGCGISVMIQAWVTDVGWLVPLRMVQGALFSALIPSVFCQICRSGDPRLHGTRVGLANSCLTGGQIQGSLLASACLVTLSTPWVLMVMGGLFIVGAAWVAVGKIPQADSGRSCPAVHAFTGETSEGQTG
ncbi:MFS transporter [Staphylospora marina]|uniref:MFS transporter n=1 Tax=Staphylospora marina TaxID=2490858 RepID=UPI000F5C2317|nr:MFS transporter [Staphylospora marina]